MEEGSEAASIIAGQGEEQPGFAALLSEESWQVFISPYSEGKISFFFFFHVQGARAECYVL